MSNKISTPTDFAFLRENIDKMSYQEMAAHFGVSLWTVRNRCKQQQITKSRRTYARKKFTPDVDTFIREHLEKLTIAEIADKVNLSHSGVSKRIRQMKLKKTPVRVHISESNLAWLKNNVDAHRFEDISKRLGISPPALRRIMRQYGIQKQPARVRAQITTTVRREKPAAQVKPEKVKPDNKIRFTYNPDAPTSREQQLLEFMSRIGATHIEKRKHIQ